jgi:hypothetical protein
MRHSITSSASARSVDAAFAAIAGRVLRVAAITVTCRRTRSAARRQQLIAVALRPAIIDSDVLSFDVAGFAQALVETGEMSSDAGGRSAVEGPDHRASPAVARASTLHSPAWHASSPSNN